MAEADRATLKVDCSFCGTTLMGDDAKDRSVAGPAVFIWRDCVDLCIDVFAQKDAAWRDAAIRQLENAKSSRGTGPDSSLQ